MFMSSPAAARIWITFCLTFSVVHSGEVSPFYGPSYCAVDEYFDAYQLKCITCDSDKNLVASHNGLTCVCNDRSRIVSASAGPFPVCELCSPDSVPTKDRRDCVPCSREGSTKGNLTQCEGFECPPNHATLDRWPNGTLLDSVHCVRCGNMSRLSSTGSECVPCIDADNCTCSSGERRVDDELCVPSELVKDWPEDADTFTVTFVNGKKVHSQFLNDHLLRVVALCKLNNRDACQFAANLCVMTLYSEKEKSGPCALFKEHKRIPVANTEGLPWLYYGEGEAPAVLGRRKIPTRHSLDYTSKMSYLNLTGVIYNLNGTLKDIRKISGSALQLCPGSWKSFDRSFRFASKYSHSCEISAKQLVTGKRLEFVDLFLRYKDEDGEFLHAVPVLVGDHPKTDTTQWQLVRRFFLVDNVLGVAYEPDATWTEGATAEVVRYAKEVVLNVKLQGADDEGKIFVPYLRINYGELTREDVEKNAIVSLKFEVNYEMDNSLTHALEICLGVFSALAVIWSSIRTWSHSRRSGRATIDVVTLAYLLLFVCGNLANVFFLVVFCTSLNAFVFFKGQSAIHVLLPNESQEETIKIFIILAFFLKIVEICHLLYYQVTIDIFFIDWERPRARNLVPRNVPNGTSDSDRDDQQPVSIWRTYFVANEWNEIQTKRKLNTNLHLLITVLMLECFGMKNWTTTDPELFFETDSIGKSSSFTCRLAVGGLIFLLTYTCQWLFTALVYEPYIKNGIQEFVDVCSMANISVFILALENYGFYIHGRSAHGFADTDMQSIINQLHREEEDLVGHRGLLPGTDQQTFEMVVPPQLRSYYRKVMAPLKSVGQSKRLGGSQGAGLRTKCGMENVDRSIQAYRNMNRFLAAFLEHALKDLDYEVREKMFSESLFGIEFTESPDKGILYSDNGHSFDNVLFYGNEFSLLTFDIMLFCFVEAVSQDYLVAGIVTAAAAHFMSMVRDLGGRKNLAKKTLIDERFLI